MGGEVAFYSVPNVARLLGLTRESVRQEILRGHLDATKYGSKYQITSESLHKWINDATEQAREATLSRRIHDHKLSALPRTTPRGGENRGVAALLAVIGEGSTAKKRPQSS